MAIYAILDSDSKVVDVIVGLDVSGKKQTQEYLESYYSELFGASVKMTFKDRSQRKNFAGIGYLFDSERDAFIAPKPFESWVLNEETCEWECTIPYPTDGRMYFWDESILDWTPVNDSSETA